MPDLKEYVLEGKSELLRQAVQEDPSAALKKDDDGRTALFWAVSGNKAEMVSELLKVLSSDSKFDINEGDEAGWTVLHVAAGTGSLEIVELLLAHGPTLDARSNTGQTPLFAAVSKGHLAVAKRLLEAGASARVKDTGGHTCLQRAAATGNLDMVKLLLAAGAPINASDNQGWTALHYAFADGQAEACLALIRAGADLEKQDADGKPPPDVSPDAGFAEHVAFEYKREKAAAN